MRRVQVSLQSVALALTIIAVVPFVVVSGVNAHGPAGHKLRKERLRFKKAPEQPVRPDAERGDSGASAAKEDHNALPMRLDTKVMYQRLDPARDTALEMAEINNQSTPAYEISDCTTGPTPEICCKYDTANKGSDCGVFKMVCDEWGWQTEGDPASARCSAP